MKRQYSYDLAHKVMRVRASDYAFLLEVSRRDGVPMAEALHQVLQHKEQEKKEKLAA